MSENKITKIVAPISAAELMDKIAILEIKEKKISDPEKLKNVLYELGILKKIFEENIELTSELTVLFDTLREVNANGWEIEDIKRTCEKDNDFGEKFIKAAIGAFQNNDKRALVWKEINLALGSDIVQEKSYK